MYALRLNAKIFPCECVRKVLVTTSMYIHKCKYTSTEHYHPSSNVTPLKILVELIWSFKKWMSQGKKIEIGGQFWVNRLKIHNNQMKHMSLDWILVQKQLDVLGNFECRHHLILLNNFNSFQCNNDIVLHKKISLFLGDAWWSF